MNEKAKKRPVFLRILKVILIIVLVLIAAFGIIVAYLTFSEFRPAEGAQEEVEIRQPNDAVLPEDGSIRILTWNIGYGALGSNADFFMDGGKSVYTADQERVTGNVASILDSIASQKPDIVFLQEVDVDSSRSRHIDETDLAMKAFPQMEASFAYNFSVPFVPYPLPPIGTVGSGIMTLSSWHQTSALREALPCPFSWPVRIANLKRCLLISRIPAEDGKELVLVNLHLEAYDDGEGKAAQTSQLRKVLEDEASRGNYVIAGGDFNQVFSNVDADAYPAQEGKWQAGAVDVSEFSPDLQFLMDSETPTCRSLDQPYDGADPEKFQYYMIDGFIVSSNLKVKSLRTLDQGFHWTDHNPVLLEVESG